MRHYNMQSGSIANVATGNIGRSRNASDHSAKETAG